MKKPTGKNGTTRISINGKGDKDVQFLPHEYPEEKDNIEEKIVINFISSANSDLEKHGEKFILAEPTKNDLDDFDFSIIGPNGESFLELMEAAPLKGVKGGYKNAPKKYRVIEIVDFIYEKVKSKSDKYPKNLGKDLFLLIYTTHFSFSLSNSAVTYLSWLFREKKLVFNAIFLFTPIDSSYGQVIGRIFRG